MQLLYIIMVFSIIFSSFFQAQAQTAGSLDPAFGAGGKVTTDFSGDFDRIFAVAIQSDGKIIVAGSARNGATTDFALARYNPDGSLDTTFDTDGKVTTDFGTRSDTVYALVIQPDGKIVAGGDARIDLTTNFALARYNPDGSLDTTFDTDGKLTTDFADDLDRIEAIALQPDGKIVAAGVTFDLNGSDFGLARYNPDGSLDQSFGSAGKLTTDFNFDTDWAFAIAIQTDGKIVAGGKSFTSTSDDFALVRYNSNGALDTTFDTDGKVTTDFANDVDEANAILLQPDGKIVATGIASLFTEGTQIDFGVARYNSDGSLDTTFDTDGKTSADFGADFDEGFAAVLQPDGKIIVGGGARPPGMGSTVNFGAARFNQNGSLDPTFDGDGKVLTAFNRLDQINAVALQADGKIIAAGYTTGINTSDFALVRYLGDTTTPTPTPTPTATPTPTPVVSGRITYANALSATGMPFTTVSASGSIPLSTTSNSTGNFSLTGFGIGAYTITPSKIGQVNGISNLDASRVAQHIVGLTTLDPTQQIAADASGNGSVSSLDAAYIAQFIASIPNPGLTGTWKFLPASRSYSDVQSDQLNQDYSAVLVGEVTGNWNPAGVLGFDLSEWKRADTFGFNLSAVDGKENAQAEEPAQETGITVKVQRNASADEEWNLTVADVTGKGIIAYQFDLYYDSTLIKAGEQACEVSGTMSEQMTAICRVNEAGVLKVAVFGIAPLTGEGTLLRLKLKAVGRAAGASSLSLQNFMFNEEVL